MRLLENAIRHMGVIRLRLAGWGMIVAKSEHSDYAVQSTTTPTLLRNALDNTNSCNCIDFENNKFHIA
mgnify:FL=1